MDIQCYIPTLISRLKACPATNSQLADAANGVVSPSWISKFRSGRMRNPQVGSIAALITAMEQFEDHPVQADAEAQQREAA